MMGNFVMQDGRMDGRTTETFTLRGNRKIINGQIKNEKKAPLRAHAIHDEQASKIELQRTKDTD